MSKSRIARIKREVSRSLSRFGVFICACLLISIPFAAQSAPTADEIHWSFTGGDSVSFEWRGTATTIRYGLSSGNYTMSSTASTPAIVPFSSPGPFQEARLSGLQPATLYYYSIGGGPEHTFRTPPLPGDSDFTVMAEGDIGDTTSYSTVAGVQSVIGATRPAFTLILGDLTYGNNHGQQVVDQHFNDVMVWSQDAAYMPAWGNHEWDSSGDDLRNYKGRFDLPNPQTSPVSPSISCCGEDWYWFDYGNARFIAYPEPYGSATWTDWKAKAQLLMDEAQADPAIHFIVTYGHRPAYSSGHHPGNSTLKGILDGLGSTHSKYVLNINGHSHNYERTLPQSGVIHVTAGTGGSTLEQDGSCLWYTCTQPAWSAFRAFHLGALKLTFSQTGIDGAFLCGPSSSRDDVSCPQGSALDSFFIPNSQYSPDTKPPKVSLTSPVIGEILSGSVVLTANARDNVGVSKVKFFANNHLLGRANRGPGRSWQFYWNTTTVADGSYSLTVKAVDAAKNFKKSRGVVIRVQNKRPVVLTGE